MPNHTKERRAADNNLEAAILLHDMMSIAGAAIDALHTILHLLNRNDITWPTIRDLQDYSNDLVSARDSLSNAELPELTRDLAIWLVERHYPHATLNAVRALKPGLRQAGFECLLRNCCDREGEALSEAQDRLLLSLVDKWIEYVWDHDMDDFVQRLDSNGIATTGQLISWLSTELDPFPDKSLAAILKKMQSLA